MHSIRWTNITSDNLILVDARNRMWRGGGRIGSEGWIHKKKTTVNVSLRFEWFKKPTACAFKGTILGLFYIWRRRKRGRHGSNSPTSYVSFTRFYLLQGKGIKKGWKLFCIYYAKCEMRNFSFLLFLLNIKGTPRREERMRVGGGVLKV